MANQGPNLTLLGKLVVFLFVLGCFYGAYYFFLQPSPQQNSSSTPTNASTTSTPTNSGFTLPGFGNSNVSAEINIAYGTEKERWLKWAIEQFNNTSSGKRIKINLFPMGSQDGARAVVEGKQAIHVWAPASSVYKNAFLQDWQSKYGNTNPILKEEVLALTPMVLVMWSDRYQPFIQNYTTVTFANIGKALQEKGGWGTIANKPEWGLFKFGHTHPIQSNSGLLTLVLMAYDYHNKCRGLAVADIVDVKFQTWLREFTKSISGLSNSTGNMMRDMVLKGPSVYDALFVYENVAIDYLKNAEGRWGSLHIIYPQRNLWNDNPYYILDAPWSSKEQREAAKVFLDFLLTETIQKQSLEHGFRPGNPSVAINTPESPFMKYQSAGLQINIPTVCDAPSGEVMTNLLNTWQRSQ